jgi:hypothetical protein
MKQTKDWGYPKESDHGHYRLYGPEGVPGLVKDLGGLEMIVFDARDEITGSPERLYFISKSRRRIEQLGECLYPHLGPLLAVPT